MRSEPDMVNVHQAKQLQVARTRRNYPLRVRVIEVRTRHGKCSSGQTASSDKN